MAKNLTPPPSRSGQMGTFWARQNPRIWTRKACDFVIFYSYIQKLKCLKTQIQTPCRGSLASKLDEKRGPKSDQKMHIFSFVFQFLTADAILNIFSKSGTFLTVGKCHPLCFPHKQMSLLIRIWTDFELAYRVPRWAGGGQILCQMSFTFFDRQL